MARNEYINNCFVILLFM